MSLYTVRYSQEFSRYEVRRTDNGALVKPFPIEGKGLEIGIAYFAAEDCARSMEIVAQYEMVNARQCSVADQIDAMPISDVLFDRPLLGHSNAVTVGVSRPQPIWANYWAWLALALIFLTTICRDDLARMIADHLFTRLP